MTVCGPGEACDGVSCVCAGLGEIHCGGGCIQPKTDSTFCGASSDCMGANAGAACTGSEVCCHGSCAMSCVGILAPSNLDPVSCEYPAATDLVVANGQVVTIDTSGPCSEVRVQSGAPDLCVLRYGQITISGTLKAQGSRALALLATGNLLVDGTVDVSAIGGGAGASTTVGGGFGTAGGSGAPAFGNATLVPLTGGSPGTTVGGAYCGNGGRAGGGLELVACGAVTISGLVSAGGAGGAGSGGGVLVEGSAVTITGSIFANGGGGGGGGFESNVEIFPLMGSGGAQATLSTAAAPGGMGAFSDCEGQSGLGGDGGAATLPTDGHAASPDCGSGLPNQCGFGCTVGCGSCTPGGAGGAVGRIRVNDSTGSPAIGAGTFSPTPTSGGIALSP